MRSVPQVPPFGTWVLGSLFSGQNPFWPQSVNHVSGTFCKGCFRTVHPNSGAGDAMKLLGLDLLRER